jgi:hypothetical protein
MGFSLTCVLAGAVFLNRIASFEPPSPQEKPPVIQVELTTKDGNILVGHSTLRTVKFESSLGTTEIKLEDVSQIEVAGEGAVVRLKDQSLIKGKLQVQTWPVQTKIGDFSAPGPNITRVVVTLILSPATNPQPSPGPSTGAPAGPPGGAPPGAATLAPAGTLALKCAVAGMRLSADGKRLYALNASDGKLLFIDPQTLEVGKEILVPGASRALSVFPGGKLMAVGGPRKIHLIDVATGKVLKTFELEQDFSQIFAADDQTLYVTGPIGFAVVSIGKQSVVERRDLANPHGYLLPTSDGKKLYLSGQVASLPSVKGGPITFVRFRDALTTADRLTLSPDDRFVACGDGRIFRTGRSFLVEMKAFAKVEPHFSACFLPTRKQLIVFTMKGELKRYSTDTWEPMDSFSTGLWVTSAVGDEARRAVYAVAGPPRRIESGVTVLVGDLYRFTLPEER